MSIKIATRTSKLALWQAQWVADKLKEKNITSSIIGFKTKGDKLLDSPLAKIGGKDLFIKELELAMLDGRADISVHSFKDFAALPSSDLAIAAVCVREDPRDALLSFKYEDLDSLPKGARVGTTSLRRQMQLKILRPDLELISLRGNIISRIEKLKSNDFAAIMLAYSGLKRLNMLKDITFVTAFDTDYFIPAAAQGALMIESKNEASLLEKLSFLNDDISYKECFIEREFTKMLNGGCGAAIGVHAKYVDNDTFKLSAVVGLFTGEEYLKDERVYKDYKSAGEDFAKEFIAKGALELIEKNNALVEELL